MSAVIAALGILLILAAIPLGFMLAPLVVGALFIWYVLGRVDAAVARADVELEERRLLGLTGGTASS